MTAANRGLKWLAVALAGLSGLLGLGMSLCGGTFLVAGLSGRGGEDYGIAWLAGASLVIGVVVLIASIRQLRAASVAEIAADSTPMPSQIKWAAILLAVGLLISGSWLFLAAIVPLLRRRPWARLMIVAVLGGKWLMGMSALWLLLGSSLNGSSAYGMMLAVVLVGIDAAVLVLLFSRQATRWLRPTPA
jgi:hypothetical protein